MNEITWAGRLFVDEPQITPEQYKMFFGRYEFGIRFNTANSILELNGIGNYEEVVPADELNMDTIDNIIDQLLCEDTEIIDETKTSADCKEIYAGTVEYEGFTLDWRWEPEITDENGEPVCFSQLEDWVQMKILNQMLKDESHWGIVEC